MYAHLSSRWVADGRVNHLVTTLPGDSEAIDSLFWNGFGLAAVDAIRDLKPVHKPESDAVIRRATPKDADAVQGLSTELRQHLAAAPVFLFPEDERGRVFYEHLLKDSSNAIWLAFCGGKAVGCIGLAPASYCAACIIRDGRTASITRAFTKEHLRGRGVGSALLNTALEWARSAGYERCAVDFEPANISGARFWLRHFLPICHTMIRHVDERVLHMRKE